MYDLSSALNSHKYMTFYTKYSSETPQFLGGLDAEVLWCTLLTIQKDVVMLALSTASQYKV